MASPGWNSDPSRGSCWNSYTGMGDGTTSKEPEY